MTAIEVNAAKMKRDIYLSLSECTEQVKRIPIAVGRFSIHLQTGMNHSLKQNLLPVRHMPDPWPTVRRYDATR